MCYDKYMANSKEQYFVSFNILNKVDELTIAKTCDGLANPIRVRIVRKLCEYPYLRPFNSLSRDLKIPKTTLNYHLSKLEEAGIIRCFYKNSQNKSTKMVSKIVNNISIDTKKVEIEEDHSKKSYLQEIPVGAYDSYVGKELDYALENETIERAILSQYDTKRFTAKLIYAKEGVVTYKVSNAFSLVNGIDELIISLEICSEAPYYDNDYKSDITFWINDKEICTLITKGDYGDRKGKLNPDWWPRINTQYGELTTIKINNDGVYLKDVLVNRGITIKNLNILSNDFIKISIGNKDFTLNKGGFNIFGSEFGDYPQNIIVEQIKY